MSENYADIKGLAITSKGIAAVRVFDRKGKKTPFFLRRLIKVSETEIIKELLVMFAEGEALDTAALDLLEENNLIAKIEP